MLFSEKAGKAESDGNTTMWLLQLCPWVMVATAQLPALLVSMKHAARAGWRTEACLLFKILSWQDGLQWCAWCFSLEAPQNSRGATRRQTLVLWGLRIAADTKIFLMGAMPWGCCFKVHDGPWLCKSWGKLPPSSSAKAGYHCPTSKGYGLAHGNSGFLVLGEQFLLLPSKKKWPG